MMAQQGYFENHRYKSKDRPSFQDNESLNEYKEKLLRSASDLNSLSSHQTMAKSQSMRNNDVNYESMANHIDQAIFSRQYRYYFT